MNEYEDLVKFRNLPLLTMAESQDARRPRGARGNSRGRRAPVSSSGRTSKSSSSDSRSKGHDHSVRGGEIICNEEITRMLDICIDNEQLGSTRVAAINGILEELPQVENVIAPSVRILKARISRLLWSDDKDVCFASSRLVSALCYRGKDVVFLEQVVSTLPSEGLRSYQLVAVFSALKDQLASSGKESKETMSVHGKSILHLCMKSLATGESEIAGAIAELLSVLIKVAPDIVAPAISDLSKAFIDRAGHGKLASSARVSFARVFAPLTPSIRSHEELRSELTSSILDTMNKEENVSCTLLSLSACLVPILISWLSKYDCELLEHMTGTLRCFSRAVAVATSRDMASIAELASHFARLGEIVRIVKTIPGSISASLFQFLQHSMWKTDDLSPSGSAVADALGMLVHKWSIDSTIFETRMNILMRTATFFSSKGTLSCALKVFQDTSQLSRAIGESHLLSSILFQRAIGTNSEDARGVMLILAPRMVIFQQMDGGVKDYNNKNVALELALQPRGLKFEEEHLHRLFDWLLQRNPTTILPRLFGSTSPNISTESPPDMGWLVDVLKNAPCPSSKDDVVSRKVESYEWPQVWWLCLQELAWHCITSNLKTHFGSPTETLAALEQGLLQIVSAKPVVLQVRPAYLLLEFMFALEVGIKNALHGSVSRGCPSAKSATFFAANEKVCRDWFLRMRPCLLKAAMSLQHDSLTVFHSLQRLSDLKAQLQGKKHEEPRDVSLIEKRHPVILLKRRPLSPEDVSSKASGQLNAALKVPTEPIHEAKNKQLFMDKIKEVVSCASVAMVRLEDNDGLLILKQFVDAAFSKLTTNQDDPWRWLIGMSLLAKGEFSEGLLLLSHYTHDTSISQSVLLPIIVEAYASLKDWNGLKLWIDAHPHFSTTRFLQNYEALAAWDSHAEEEYAYHKKRGISTLQVPLLLNKEIGIQAGALAAYFPSLEHGDAPTLSQAGAVLQHVLQLRLTGNANVCTMPAVASPEVAQLACLQLVQDTACLRAPVAKTQRLTGWLRPSGGTLSFYNNASFAALSRIADHDANNKRLHSFVHEHVKPRGNTAGDDYHQMLHQNIECMKSTFESSSDIHPEELWNLAYMTHEHTRGRRKKGSPLSSEDLHGYSVAFKASCRALACFADFSQYDAMPIVLQILRLIMFHAHELPCVTETLQCVPVYAWVPILPQLISCLATTTEDAQKGALTYILSSIEKALPTHVMVPAMVELHENPQNMNLMDFVRSVANPVFHNDLQIILSELTRLSVLWEEHWESLLEEAIAYNDKEQTALNLKASMECLETALDAHIDLYEKFQPSSPHDEKVHKWLLPVIKKLRGVGRMPQEKRQKLLKDTLSCVSRGCLLTLKLRSCTPELINVVKKGTLPMFGGEEDLYIAGIQDKATVLKTKTRPKKLVFLGVDGSQRTFLLKGREDLRVDQRIMQLQKSIYSAMDANSKCRTFSVTPISSSAGLIEWVESSIPLYELCVHHHNRSQERAATLAAACDRKPPGVKAFKPVNFFFSCLKAAGLDPSTPRSTWPQDVLISVLTDMMKRSPKTVIAEELFLGSASASHWLDRQRAFEETCAITSLVGHFLGLGDRHLDNILLDKVHGGLLHIDFNVIFDRGLRLRVPECVPFRLTQVMIGGLGFGGVEGRFKRVAEAALSNIRGTNSDRLCALFEVVVNDSLVNWVHDRGDKNSQKAYRLFFDLQATLQDCCVPAEIDSAVSHLGEFEKALGEFRKLCVTVLRAVEEVEECEATLEKYDQQSEKLLEEKSMVAQRVEVCDCSIKTQTAAFNMSVNAIISAQKECLEWKVGHEGALGNLFSMGELDLDFGAIDQLISPRAAVVPLGLIQPFGPLSNSIFEAALGAAPERAGVPHDILVEAARIDELGVAALTLQAFEATRLSNVLAKYVEIVKALGGREYLDRSGYCQWLRVFDEVLAGAPALEGIESGHVVIPLNPPISISQGDSDCLRARAEAYRMLESKLKFTCKELMSEKLNLATDSYGLEGRLSSLIESNDRHAVAKSVSTLCEQLSQTVDILITAEPTDAVLASLQQIALGFATTSLFVQEAFDGRDLLFCTAGVNTIAWLSDFIHCVDTIGVAAAEIQLIVPLLIGLMSSKSSRHFIEEITGGVDLLVANENIEQELEVAEKVLTIVRTSQLSLLVQLGEKLQYVENVMRQMRGIVAADDIPNDTIQLALTVANGWKALNLSNASHEVLSMAASGLVIKTVQEAMLPVLRDRLIDAARDVLASDNEEVNSLNRGEMAHSDLSEHGPFTGQGVEQALEGLELLEQSPQEFSLGDLLQQYCDVSGTMAAIESARFVLELTCDLCIKQKDEDEEFLVGEEWLDDSSKGSHASKRETFLSEIRHGIEELSTVFPGVNSWCMSVYVLISKLEKDLDLEASQHLTLKSCLTDCQSWVTRSASKCLALVQLAESVLSFEESILEWETWKKYSAVVCQMKGSAKEYGDALEEADAAHKALAEHNATSQEIKSSMHTAAINVRQAQHQINKNAFPVIKEFHTFVQELVEMAHRVDFFETLANGLAPACSVLFLLETSRLCLQGALGLPFVVSELRKSLATLKECSAALPVALKKLHGVCMEERAILQKGGRGEMAARQQAPQLVKTVGPLLETVWTTVERAKGCMCASLSQETLLLAFKAAHKVFNSLGEQLEHGHKRETSLGMGLFSPLLSVLSSCSDVERSSFAAGVVKTFRSKLLPMGDDRCALLSVEDQLAGLVAEATSPQQLACMYEGWMPWC